MAQNDPEKVILKEACKINYQRKITITVGLF